MADDLDTQSADDVPTIRAVLGQPGVRTAFALSLAARLPSTALGTLLVLRLAPAHGYTAAGAIIAVFAVSLAIAGPVWAQLLDRLGARRVLTIQSLAHGSVLAGFALLPIEAPLGLFALLGLACGATEPVHGGVMRGLWDRMLARDEERHVGYAMETASLEAMYSVSNAVFAGVVAALAGADVGLLAAALVTAAFGVWFAAVPQVRGWSKASEPGLEETDDDGPRSWLGALAHPGTRTVAVLSFGLGLHAGPVEIGITALGRSLGSNASVGLLLFVWGLGSMAAGIALTRLRPADRLVRRLALQLAWLVVVSVALLGCSTLALSAVLVFLAGTGLAPFFTTLNASYDRVAAGESVAELYAISMSGMLCGTLLSAPIAGALIDHASPQAGLVASALGPAVALLVLLARRGDFAANEPAASSRRAAGAAGGG